MGRSRTINAGRFLGATLMTLAVALISGCSSAPTKPSGTIMIGSGVTATLPDGWHLIRKPINDVVEPRQVLAAASTRVKLGSEPEPGCRPDRLLDDLPADEAAVQIVEWTQGARRDQRPNLRGYPERPDQLRLDRRRSYECNGLSYNLSFRDHGRAFQAFVWLDPATVEPLVRRQALELLNSLEVERRKR